MTLALGFFTTIFDMGERDTSMWIVLAHEVSIPFMCRGPHNKKSPNNSGYGHRCFCYGLRPVSQEAPPP